MLLSQQALPREAAVFNAGQREGTGALPYNVVGHYEKIQDIDHQTISYVITVCGD